MTVLIPLVIHGRSLSSHETVLLGYNLNKYSKVGHSIQIPGIPQFHLQKAPPIL